MKNIMGNNEIYKLLSISFEINLIVVSEKIIIASPEKKVINLNKLYFKFSFE